MATLMMGWGMTGRIVLTLNARRQPEQSPQVLRLLGELQDARQEAEGNGVLMRTRVLMPVTAGSVG